MRLHNFRRFLVVLLVLALVSAGCSGDDEVAEEGESSSTTVSESGTELDDAEPDDTVADEATSETVEDEVSPTSTVPELLTDVGVNDREIRIGYSLDLSGPLSAVDATILDAHIAYFADVNEQGGMVGRRVEIVALDHASDLDAHVDNVAALSETGDSGVVAFGSVGSDELLTAVVSRLAEQDVAAVVRGSVDNGSRGEARLLTIGETTCVDTVMGLTNLVSSAQSGSPTLAILTRPGSYGRESAVAARAVAQQLELEVVVDARVTDDNADVIEELIEASPDVVWVALSPRELGQVVGAVSGIVSEWRWSGTPQSYDSALLQSDAAPGLAQWYTHVASIDPFDQDDGAERAQAIRQAIPDWRYSDADSLAFGWQQAELLHAALAAAAEAGDMRREAIAPDPNALIAEFETTSPTRLFAVDPTIATIEERLNVSGSTGLVEVAVVEVTDPELEAICD